MFGKRSIISFILFFSVKIVLAGWQEEVNDLKQQLDTIEDDSMKVEYYLSIGSKYLPNIPEAGFSYFLKAKQLAKQINDSSLLAYVMFNICDYFVSTSEYKLALETAAEGLTLCPKDKMLLSIGNEKMSEAYSFMGFFDEALKCNKISLALEIERKDTLRIAQTLDLIGIYFLEMDILDSALYYLHQANAYTISINGKPSTFDLSHLGHTYTYLGEFDSALHYHYLAYHSDLILDNGDDLAYDEYYIAFTYYKSGQYDSVKKYTDRCIKRSKELGLYAALMYSYNLLYELYEAQGNYKEALKYSVLKNVCSDTLYERNKRLYISGIEAKFKFEEQQEVLEATEARNKLLEKQSQLMTILAIVGFLLLGSMVVIIVLITKRNQANQKLLNDVEQANIAKEKLISVISHDLKGLIGTIRNGLKYTIEDSLDFDSVKKMVKSFYSVVESTYDLLENLLTWARNSKESLEPTFTAIDLHDLSKQSISHVAYLAEKKNIEIKNNISKISIEADENMVLTILRNVFSNAIKFSPVNSVVILSSQMNGSNIEIIVKDYGIGISDEILNDICNNNLTRMYTKGTLGERGSGLGLSICKSFIEKHRGELRAESETGKGTVFYIKLPLQQKKPTCFN
jgi:signal transduction histidine kinase